ncbi:DEAD/DEAH box helicase [Cetobacterium sp. 8H]|uniref:helicase C-terminal domain-containing protein n=1 Tax=Cetobacterium sp. 8H TaxID=2759681 RepID=UPI00163C88E9|nr:helicase C-terminal domain-containing protein [Cetobacterium sp. 8H]MBC2851593.1 DEAD/DEAH box helicase [Cetobacterium sp. 8H]
MNIEEKISSEARERILSEIKKAKGNEVFFRGIPDEDGVVTEVEVLARGNKYSVPAILRAMKKGEVIIHNHPSGHLYPSDPDVEIAALYSNRLDGASYIINNEVNDIYVIVELSLKKNIKIDIKPYFEKNGLLAGVFNEFEYRNEQLEMAEVIENGLNTETKVIVEAGTGTGKTLGYLIPAIEWSIKNKKRVVITTNTINLQEQLLNKDIPIAKKVIQGDFSYILVKGRGNYLCNRKLSNVATGDIVDFEEFSQSQKSQFKEVVRWGGKTDTGDKAELPFEVDYSIWEHFQSESDMCAGSKCPFKAECFFLKARDEKKKADILITNHHMYFSDLAIRKEIGFNTEYSILPEYELVVFDEAHNVEKVARDYFSYEVSKYGFTKTMNQIYTLEKSKKRGTGSLDIFINYLKHSDFDGKKGIEKDLENDIKLRHRNVLNSGRAYFNFLIDVFSKGQMTSTTYRLKKGEFERAKFYAQLDNLKDEFISDISSYLKKVRGILGKLKDLEDKEGYMSDYSRYIDRLDGFFENLKFITSLEDEKFIYWVEVNGKKSNSKMVATPLKIDGELDKNLYSNLKQMIFTSATIAIGDDFSYFKESIGLKEKTLEKVIHSPFDYNNQMKVYLPKDLLNPSDPKFIDSIRVFLKDLILKTSGKCFILFTSYSTLNYIYYMIKDELEEAGLNLLIQGQAPRTQLVNLYKTIKNPVLFGTDSFWEGVDIKGEQLSSVIIVKLPFKVPSDPVTEAIIESITQQNKNAFVEYQIPESVIKFKQGIGRLIRSKSDKGIVTILDNRVITKSYGKYFKDAIPTKNIKILTKEEVLKDISKT